MPKILRAGSGYAPRASTRTSGPAHWNPASRLACINGSRYAGCDPLLMKLIEHSNAAYARSGSPILAGDKLLIHFTDLVALDAKTGSEAWRVKRPTSHGTPLVT